MGRAWSIQRWPNATARPHPSTHPPSPTHTTKPTKTAYLRYAAQIRQEYAHVPRPTYLTARANVLSSFLGRERIFVSEYYHGRLEAPARGNVAAEVALLRGGVIPGERQEEGEEG